MTDTKQPTPRVQPVRRRQQRYGVIPHDQVLTFNEERKAGVCAYHLATLGRQ